MRIFTKLRSLCFEFLCCVVLLSGCDTPSSQSKPAQQIFPYLPSPYAIPEQKPPLTKGDETLLDLLPLPKSDPRISLHFQSILSHPWVESQPDVTLFSLRIVEDIQSLERAYEIVNLKRLREGLPTPSFEEDTHTIIALIQQMQSQLNVLHLNDPRKYYHILNIPETSPDIYSTPLPFQTYKRIYLGESTFNMPLYIDLRGFDFQNQETRNQAIQAIIYWHLDLLKEGKQAFKAYRAENSFVFIGKGDRNVQHFDNAHGIALKNRGLLLAFIPTYSRLYVLYFDAPFSDIQNHQSIFFEILNRPVEEKSQALETFSFSFPSSSQ